MRRMLPGVSESATLNLKISARSMTKQSHRQHSSHKAIMGALRIRDRPFDASLSANSRFRTSPTLPTSPAPFSTSFFYARFSYLLASSQNKRAPRRWSAAVSSNLGTESLFLFGPTPLSDVTTHAHIICKSSLTSSHFLDHYSNLLMH